MGLTFNWEINIGQVLSVVIFLLGVWGGAIRLYHLLDKRMDRFELTLGEHARTLVEHSGRMTNYERDMVDVVGDLQRTIGRVETALQPSRWNNRDPRETS